MPHKKDKAVLLTQELVRVPSVTAVDPALRAESQKALKILADYARAHGATVTDLSYSGGHPKWDYAVDNIFIDWVVGKPEKHLCYLGHIDVVPPGDASRWRDDPFSGIIRDGYLYGRGTTDMKGSVAAFATAVESALPKIQNARISMVITADEEWAAINGTRKVLAWMADQGMKPDAFIVGEPSSHDHLGTHIKVGRRGSLVGTFNIQGVQGHAAYQELFDNPNRALALAVTILNSRIWNDGNENFPNTNFEAVAVKSGDFGASAVIPGTAELMWNIRFTPSQTPDGLEKWILDTLANPPQWAKDHPDFDRLKNIKVTANKDTASMPYYKAPDALADAATSAVKSHAHICAKLDGSGGTTDGRFVSTHFPDAEIIELGLPERGGIAGEKPQDYLAKGGMHQADERAALKDIVNLRLIFEDTIGNYCSRRQQNGVNTHGNDDIDRGNADENGRHPKAPARRCG